MKKRLLAAALALGLLAALAGCGEKTEQQTVADALGLDVSAGTVTASADSHGGFHGDGLAFLALAFSDDALKQQLAADPAWQPLPMDDTTQALVWGLEEGSYSFGPLLTGDGGEPLVPEVEAGCYRLIDRHRDKDTPLLERASFNFTVAVYDADARILYYCELDT